MNVEIENTQMENKYRAYWENKIRNDIEYNSDGQPIVEYSWLLNLLIWKHYWGDKLNPEEFSVRYDPNYDYPYLLFDNQFRSFILLRGNEKNGTLKDSADICFAYTVREHRNKGIMSKLIDRACQKYKKISVSVPKEKEEFWIKKGFKEVRNWIDINDKITVFLDKYNKI